MFACLIEKPKWRRLAAAKYNVTEHEQCRYITILHLLKKKNARTDCLQCVGKYVLFSTFSCMYNMYLYVCSK